MLQLAVESDSKKEALLEELKVATRDTKLKLDNDRLAFTRDKELFELQRKEIREEAMHLKAKVEELDYANRQLLLKTDKQQQHLADKEAELDKLARDLDMNKRLLREC